MFTDKSSLIFLHNNRTSGNSFTNILIDTIGEDSVFKMGTRNDHWYTMDDFISVARAGKPMVFAGHFGYGAHRYIPGPCRYVTILRDPVIRVLSFFSRWVNTAGVSFDEFFNSDYQASNGMVQRLCGLGAGSTGYEVYDYLSDQEIPNPIDVQPAHLESASQNLDRHFEVIMFQEYFVESVVLFRRTFNFPPMFSFSRQFVNRALVPVTSTGLTDAQFDFVAERNQYDRILYEKKKQEFLDIIAQADDEFLEELRIYRRISDVLFDPDNQVTSIKSTLEKLEVSLTGLADGGELPEAIRTMQYLLACPASALGLAMIARSFGRRYGCSEELDAGLPWLRPTAVAPLSH